MRNGELYQLGVVIGKGQRVIFRDSLKLFPATLDSLAKSLCPELGSKGKIYHDSVCLKDLKRMKDELLEYMKEEIYLLGGIMKKGKDINWKKYGIDIVSNMTISSLALEIYRKEYYDSKKFPIGLPTLNEDAFIRRAGGHTDVYKPKGENLYYYYVNSLYPFVMMRNPMPIGNPTWEGDLRDRRIEELFGFIEAYIMCPNSINKPFLPEENNQKQLLFPTGKFTGVYFSEELELKRLATK